MEMPVTRNPDLVRPTTRTLPRSVTRPSSAAASASIILVLLFPVLGLPREWTDNTGKHRVEAEFACATEEWVGLKTSDGTLLRVPLSRLSEEDRQFVRQQISEAEDEEGEKARQVAEGPPPTFKVIGGIPGRILTMRFSPSGKYLAINTSATDTIQLWDISSGSRVREFRYHSEKYQWVRMAFSYDGRYLAAAPENGCHAWDVRSGRKVLEAHAESYSRLRGSLAFAPDSRALFVCGNDFESDSRETIYCYQFPSGKLLAKFPLSSSTSHVASLAVSPDGKFLAAATEHVFNYHQIDLPDGGFTPKGEWAFGIQVFHLPSQRAVDALLTKYPEGNDSVLPGGWLPEVGLAYHPQKNELCFGGPEPSRWRPGSRRAEKLFSEVHSLTGFFLTGDGTRREGGVLHSTNDLSVMVSHGDFDSSPPPYVCVWRGPDLKLVRKWAAQELHAPVALSPDGATLAMVKLPLPKATDSAVHLLQLGREP